MRDYSVFHRHLSGLSWLNGFFICSHMLTWISSDLGGTYPGTKHHDNSHRRKVNNLALCHLSCATQRKSKSGFSDFLVDGKKGY